MSSSGLCLPTSCLPRKRFCAEEKAELLKSSCRGADDFMEAPTPAQARRSMPRSKLLYQKILYYPLQQGVEHFDKNDSTSNATLETTLDAPALSPASTCAGSQEDSDGTRHQTLTAQGRNLLSNTRNHQSAKDAENVHQLGVALQASSLSSSWSLLAEEVEENQPKKFNLSPPSIHERSNFLLSEIDEKACDTHLPYLPSQQNGQYFPTTTVDCPDATDGGSLISDVTEALYPPPYLARSFDRFSSRQNADMRTKRSRRLRTGFRRLMQFHTKGSSGQF